MAEVPLTLLDLKNLVTQIVQHTRPIPSSSAELVQSINFGASKAVRAIASARYEAFQSFVDPFQLRSGIKEYDLSLIDPPVWRPHKLIVDGSGGTTRVITFKYRAITSAEFQDSEVSRAGTFNALFYDILTGMLPGTAQAATGGSGTTVNIPSTVDFAVGTLVSVAGAGTTQALPGGGTIPTTYRGIVQAIVANVSLTVEPPMPVAPSVGAAVTPLRRRVLVIVPAVSADIAGRLWFQYRPAKLVADTDQVDPWLSEHRDMIVWYAASALLLAVNDTQGRVWFEQAQEMRSELLQDLDPLAGGASEALDSDLWTTD